MTVAMTTLTKHSRAIQRILDQAPPADVDKLLSAGPVRRAWHGLTGRTTQVMRQQQTREAFLTDQLQRMQGRKNFYRNALAIGAPAAALGVVGAAGAAWLMDGRDGEISRLNRRVEELTGALNRQNQQPPFQVQTQILPGNLPYTRSDYQRYLPETSQRYTLVDKDGRTREAYLYKMRDTERWMADDGTEYMLAPDGQGRHNILNEQRAGTRNSSIVVTPKPGTFLMSMPYADYEKSREFLLQQGLKPTAILGTGSIEKANGDTSVFARMDLSGDTYRPAGYHYFNPQRFNGQQTPPVEFATNLNKWFGNIHGFYTTRDGQTRFFSVEGVDIPSRNRLIEELKNRPDVVNISLDAWPVTPGTQAPPAIGQVRALRAFDREGKLLGVINTPPIGFPDQWTVAQNIYGDQLGYVSALDGDFYAQFHLPGSEHSSEIPLGFKNGLLLVEPNVDNTQYTPPSPEEQARRRAEFQRQRIKDLFGDLWEKITNRR